MAERDRLQSQKVVFQKELKRIEVRFLDAHAWGHKAYLLNRTKITLGSTPIQL